MTVVYCHPQVYWVDLDYLQVASAAIQCRAFFTALLYLEAWCEDKYGRLQLGPPAAPVPAPEPAAAGRKRRGEAAAPAPAAAGGLRGGGGGGWRWRVRAVQACCRLVRCASLAAV